MVDPKICPGIVSRGGGDGVTPGLEPGTSMLQAPIDMNEPSVPTNKIYGNEIYVYDN